MIRPLVLLSVISALSSCGLKRSSQASLKADPLPLGNEVALETRPENDSCLAFARPSENTAVKLERLGKNEFPEIVGLQQAPNSKRFYAVRRTGQIETFTAESGKAMFLDLSSVVNARPGEGGLLGMAWHPSKKNEFYLSYTLPSANSPANLRSTIARFTADSETSATYKPEILFAFEQPYENHNGGHIAFGHDGYLYLAFGDGGSGGDPLNNAQNLNVLYGKLLRIDVNAPTGYAIPKDNPFVNEPNTKPEIYAYGLRNPWRFQFDKATGELWLGDVGQNLWEEIDKIEKGGNYGWNVREGFNCYENNAKCGTASYSEPVASYGHDQGASVSGGFVYRGKAIPSLQGIYVFGDFMSGNIWGLFPDTNGKLKQKLLIATGFNIPAFGEDGDGEIYVLQYSGQIHRIVPKDANAAVVKAPALLSQTGCFNPSKVSEPVKGLIPYSVNSPLWSDAAAKRRWFGLPKDGKINVLDSGRFEFPNGTVLVKEFALQDKPIETRLFIRHADGAWAGYTYAWKDDGSDADLVNNGLVKTIAGQVWNYPSQAQCLQCHTANAGFTLGLELSQLNKQVGAVGSQYSQLENFAKIGLFTKPLADTTLALPTPSPAIAADLSARSYIHSNCSFCHRPGGTGGGNLDMRFETELKQTGLCNKPGSGSLGIADARVIFPGSPEKSILYARMSRRGTQQMPPLASNHTDDAALAIMKEWITTLNECPETAPNPAASVNIGDVITLEARHSHKCMDLDSGNNANGAKIHQWACDGGQNQKFRVEKGTDGGFSLVNVKSNKCVDVSDISQANGAKVHQWTCSNNANQSVSFSNSLDGAVHVQFKHSAKCLEVEAFSTANGAKIQQYECGNTENQDWFIRR
jgi:uncharacterized repeat protein (TIGR03806 family)